VPPILKKEKLENLGRKSEAEVSVEKPMEFDKLQKTLSGRGKEESHLPFIRGHQSDLDL